MLHLEANNFNCRAERDRHMLSVEALPNGNVTTKIYDATNTLVETDVTNYTLSSSDLLALVSATAQTSSGTIMATAQ